MAKKSSSDYEKQVDRDRYFADAHAARMKKLREVPDFVTGVEVSAINDGRTCEECSQLDGNKYDLEDAPDLPFAKCTSESGCRCIVVPVTVIDED